MAISRTLLSASTNGGPVLVQATATAGTTIHTADASAKDELWLWATNNSNTSVKLTMEFGGAGNITEQTLAAEDGLVLVSPGLTFTGSLVIRAFAGTANVTQCFGYVNRIS